MPLRLRLASSKPSYSSCRSSSNHSTCWYYSVQSRSKISSCPSSSPYASPHFSSRHLGLSPPLPVTARQQQQQRPAWQQQVRRNTGAPRSVRMTRGDRPRMRMHAPVTRADIPEEMWDPGFFDKKMVSHSDLMTGLSGGGQDCVRILDVFMDIVGEYGSNAKRRANAMMEDPRIDAFGLHAVGLMVGLRCRAFWSTAAETLVEMAYPPTILTMYRVILSGFSVPDGENVRTKFKNLLASGRSANAVALRALEMGMRGAPEKEVIALLDKADEMGAREVANPHSKSNYDYFEDSQVIRGKLLWISGRKEEATEHLRQAALEFKIPGAMFWYAKTLEMDDPAREILMARSGVLMCAVISEENEKLHSWCAARAEERGDKAACSFHAMTGQSWGLVKEIARRRTADLEWLYTEEKKVIGLENNL